MSKDVNHVYGTDRYGNHLDITYSGTETPELELSGELDLRVNATKILIKKTLEPLEKGEKAGDFLIGDKVAALYLNEIGEFYRHCNGNAEDWAGYSNLEIVQHFLDEQLSIREIAAVIEKDNELRK